MIKAKNIGFNLNWSTILIYKLTLIIGCQTATLPKQNCISHQNQDQKKDEIKISWKISVNNTSISNASIRFVPILEDPSAVEISFEECRFHSFINTFQLSYSELKDKNGNIKSVLIFLDSHSTLQDIHEKDENKRSTYSFSKNIRFRKGQDVITKRDSYYCLLGQIEDNSRKSLTNFSITYIWQLTMVNNKLKVEPFTRPSPNHISNIKSIMTDWFSDRDYNIKSIDIDSKAEI